MLKFNLSYKYWCWINLVRVLNKVQNLRFVWEQIVASLDCGNLSTPNPPSMNRRPIDGLRVRQQREGLRIVNAGTNEELDVIAESMDLLWGQTTALKTHSLSVENVTVSEWVHYVVFFVKHWSNKPVNTFVLYQCQIDLTKPWCMSTSSTSIYESTRCDPWSPENTSSYEESFSRFS